MKMKNGKVLFIEPRSIQNTFARWQRFAPLLGPIYLATIAERAGYDAVVLNENVLERDIQDEELAEADQICLTCMTATVERGKAIAQRYRELRATRRLPAIAHIGGIHASMLPEDVTPYFDHVVLGEGELILLDLLAGNFSQQIVNGELMEDLDALPFLNYGLLKGWQPGHVKSMMTSRGCPFDCDFCSVNKMFGRRYRSQSPERIIAEIRQCTKGYIFFADDNFAADIRHTSQLLTLMQQTQDFDRPWLAQVRTDVTKHPELVAQMRASGCKWIFMGCESVHSKTLHDMNKHHTREDIIRSIDVFHSHNIRVDAMFILGNDSDPPDVFKTTAGFVAQANIDMPIYWILTPLPGTSLFQRYEQQGRLLHKNWDHYNMLHTVFRPNQFSPLDLQKGMMRCYNEFYIWQNAFRDAYRTLGETVKAGYRKLRSRPANLPSGWSPVIKFGARKMLREWEEQDTKYLNYLREVDTLRR